MDSHEKDLVFDFGEQLPTCEDISIIITAERIAFTKGYRVYMRGVTNGVWAFLSVMTQGRLYLLPPNLSEDDDFNEVRWE